MLAVQVPEVHWKPIVHAAPMACFGAHTSPGVQYEVAVTQSVWTAHILVSGHGEQFGPPQSTSDSLWFWIVSEHVGAAVQLEVRIAVQFMQVRVPFGFAPPVWLEHVAIPKFVVSHTSPPLIDPLPHDGELVHAEKSNVHP